MKFIKVLLPISAFICSSQIYSRDSTNYIVNGDFELDNLNWRIYTGTKTSREKSLFEYEMIPARNLKTAYLQGTAVIRSSGTC
jgi:hypothetical protein